jgi:UDP-N-acetylmuramoylalanine--D-glutamate ligase
VVVDSADNPILRERAARLEELGIEVLLGSSDFPADVDQVVTSPGIPPGLLAPYRERKIPVLGELEIGCREVAVPIVAVTGTNGKSTVVTNIAKGLNDSGKKAAAIGNLGTPITEWVNSGEAVDVVVIEVSSYQLETIVEFHPRVAIVLNIAPDHLNHHGTLDAYVNAKARICQNQTIDDVLLLHRDLGIYPQLQKTRGRMYWYGRGLGASLDGLSLHGSQLTWRGGGPEWSQIVQTGDLPPHDVDNLLACVASLFLLGVPPEEAVRIFSNPVRLPHRLELVGAVKGVRYVNDSKATNAHAAVAALRAVSGRVIWLAGGEGKGEDLSELVSVVHDGHVVLAICFGRDREIFQKALASQVAVESRPTLREAFELASQVAGEGDTVLLSPACASFDEFRSFEDRGDQFRGWVRALSERPS